MDKIFCVEDDEGIRELIVYAASSAGFHCRGFERASDFENALKNDAPAMILLDIMLPDKDGIDILRELRENNKTKKIPVIMITAKSSERDKVTALDLGADDYITKPFGVMELISRIKAVLRRSGGAYEEVMEYEGIVLDGKSRTLTVDGESAELTYKEFELLKCLLENRDMAVTRTMLLEKIWGYHFEGESRTLDVHIGSLRHKLGEKGKLIKTVRNVGYKI